MCGTFGQKKLPLKKVKLEFLPETDIIPKEGKELNLNTWTGKFAAILSPNQPAQYSWAQFGFSPSWAQKKMYLFNARVEGDFNKENAPDFDGEKGIFKKPGLRTAIKTRRCIIPMDFFVEGSEKEKYNKPFLIHRKDSEPFFVGGIFEDWVDKETGEITTTFSILTTSAAPLLQKVGHHRSPLLLKPDVIPDWLNPKTDIELIKQLMKPADTIDFEAYSIDSKIVKSKVNNPEIETPISDELITD